MSALGLHGLIYLALTLSTTPPLQPILDKVISVQIFENNPPAPTPAPLPAIDTVIEPPPETVPTAPPSPAVTVPEPTPKPAPKPIPDSVRTPPTQPTAPPIITAPVIIAQPPSDEEDDKPSGNAYIPSQWALEPALSKDRLQGLFGDGFESDINCIRSLSEDCTSLRKQVFANYQLSEQDLIWSPSFAHNGLTDPELHGLSEREIRQKLAIPTAGDNAFVILPGIAIDGNFWDTLHGVNKKCPVLRGIRRCPDLAPKADDKRFHIPKKDTP